MKFEFAKATDITQYCKKHFEFQYKDYEKIFITPDVWDFHILRILKGYGEDYAENPDSYILEWNKISMESKGEKISSFNKLSKILKEDEGLENWDYSTFDSLEECIEEVDQGFGIN